MTERVYVTSTDELDHGERVVVEVGDRSIGVINYDGEYHAVANTCPHQGGPVCTGLVRGKLVADWPAPGERTEEYVDEDQPTLSCPWHGWEFDLETGRHLGDPEVGVTKFETVVEDGEIYVQV